MPRLDTTIKTPDGICPAAIFTPAGIAGPWPAVIFFMDGFGIRPAMWEMGQRLADAGALPGMGGLLVEAEFKRHGALRECSRTGKQEGPAAARAFPPGQTSAP